MQFNSKKKIGRFFIGTTKINKPKRGIPYSIWTQFISRRSTGFRVGCEIAMQTASEKWNHNKFEGRKTFHSRFWKSQLLGWFRRMDPLSPMTGYLAIVLMLTRDTVCTPSASRLCKSRRAQNNFTINFEMFIFLHLKLALCLSKSGLRSGVT